MKAFDAIREVFAATPQAKKRGFKSGHFSFNIPGGRCEACEGDGTVTVEMQFLADVELVCEECRGTRFKSSVLEVRFRDKNIHEVLALTVHEALQFFAGVPKVLSKLKILDEIGLGYLRLGQSATTLSGGEAQRLKLAAHLAHTANPGVLYIFDEPTTGLHFDDIQKLLTAFRKLLDGGASIVVIEHNLDVIKSADWVIDLGPEGGALGGKIVATGTPEQVARNPHSHTAKYLARALKEHANGRNDVRNGVHQTNAGHRGSAKENHSSPILTAHRRATLANRNTIPTGNEAPMKPMWKAFCAFAFLACASGAPAARARPQQSPGQRPASARQQPPATRLLAIRLRRTRGRRREAPTYSLLSLRKRNRRSIAATTMPPSNC